jgi:hypothetical protein
MGTLIAKPKRMKDKIGLDLRIIANGKDQQQAALAKAEFRRRVRNLAGAVIPEWEKAIRGPDPSRWKIPA